MHNPIPQPPFSKQQKDFFLAENASISRLSRRRGSLETRTFAAQQAASDPRFRIVMRGSASGTSSPNPTPHVLLPKQLPHPLYRAIDSSAIADIDPQLAQLPLDLLHHKLKIQGPSMFQVITTAVYDLVGSKIPQHMDIQITDHSSSPPTHMLAVHEAVPDGLGCGKIAIVPFHSILYASHFADSPLLPRATLYQHNKDTVGAIRLRLPVVRLQVPNVTTFGLLTHYIYTKRADQLLASLLRLPPHSPSPSSGPTALSQALADAVPHRELLEHAQRIRAFWGNVCALGVFDSELTRCVDMAWSIQLEALKIVSGRA